MKKNHQQMDRNTQPLISVIIPAYNCENYIEKCISSVLSQTYQNFEILIINDGSKDGTLEKINLFRNDERLKIFDIENGGVSNARNLGINNSSGDYICFIDSDDWIEKEYLSYFIRTNLSSDILYIQNLYRDYASRLDLLFHIEKPIILDLKTEIEEAILKFNLIRHGFPFCKFYNSKIIKENNIRFDTRLALAEDLIFLLNYIKYVKKITYLPIAYYHYIYLKNSARSKKHAFDAYYHLHLQFSENIRSFEHHYKIKRYLEPYKFDNFECALDSLYYHNVPVSERYKNIKKLKRVIPDIDIKNLSTNRKIILNLVKFPLLLDVYQLFKLSLHKIKRK